MTFVDEPYVRADVQVCFVDTNILYEPGGAPDGSDAIVNDDIGAIRDALHAGHRGRADGSSTTPSSSPEMATRGDRVSPPSSALRRSVALIAVFSELPHGDRGEVGVSE